MAVSRRNVTSGQDVGSSSSCTFSPTKPTGTVDGDLIRVFFSADGLASGGTVTASPSGWTTIFSPIQSTADGQWLHGWEKVASSEPASWSWTVTIATANVLTWAVISHTGQDATYEDVTPVTTINNTAAASVVSVALSGLTTVTDGCMLLWVAAGDPNTNNTGSFTEPSGFTAGVNLYSNFAPLIVCDKAQGTQGATGTLTGLLSFASGGAGFETAPLLMALGFPFSSW